MLGLFLAAVGSGAALSAAFMLLIPDQGGASSLELTVVAAAGLCLLTLGAVMV